VIPVTTRMSRKAVLKVSEFKSHNREILIVNVIDC